MTFRSRALAALGSLSLSATLLAGPVAVPAAGATPPQPSISAHLDSAALSYGERVVATGRIAPVAVDRAVVLEQRSGDGAWATLASGATSANGRYRLTATARRSGLMRVRLIATAVASDAALAETIPAPAAVASPVQRLHVSAGVRIDAARTTVRIGRRLEVRGHARPGRAGRLVLLQRRSGRHWVSIAHAHTRRHGAFALQLRPRASFTAPLRVRTVATSTLGAGARGAGRAAVLRPTLASWYGEGQSLACGGYLTGSTMGVAHKSLPCGTLVTIRYRGRQVRVPVVDRGPYIGAREFDLAPGVRNALGFDGVGTIWVAS